MAGCHSLLANLLLISGICGATNVRSKYHESMGSFVAHEDAVSTSTEMPWNTTFYAEPAVAVTGNNAPTSLDMITTYHWTKPGSYDTSQQLPSSATSLASLASTMVTSATVPQDSTYVLGVMNIRPVGKLRKRQSGSVCMSKKSLAQPANPGQIYMNAAGAITNDCTASPIYAISNGRLTAIANGTVYSYSTSPDVPYAMFVPSVVPGSIATTFNIGGGGALVWYNNAFYNGQAAFCALSNGTVYAVFQLDVQPDGCMYIQLNMFSASSCQGLRLSTITGPTGPTGPTVSYMMPLSRSVLLHADFVRARQISNAAVKGCGVS